MRRSFRGADFDALTRVWNSFYPKRYRIDADLLRHNTVDCPLFDWGASVIEEVNGEPRAFVAAKKYAPGTAYSGVKADCAHLTAVAFKEPETAVDLLAETKRILRNRGISRLVFGQDLRHFFPGCPSECRTLHDFLMVEGFASGGEVVDLERDITDYEPPRPIPDDVEVRPLIDGDTARLQQLLSNEFPGRWAYDVMAFVKQERPECAYGLFKDNRLLGFALLQDFNVKAPIAGGVWRGDLGEKWGSVGPIGVAASARGHGLGCALLSGALLEQKARGVERCIVDWTNLQEFYGKHGFKVSRRYEQMALDLESFS